MVVHTYIQGPVRYGDDGTIIYTRIRLSQLRGQQTTSGKSTYFSFFWSAVLYKIFYIVLCTLLTKLNEIGSKLLVRLIHFATSYNHTDEVGRVRFGYLDRASNFALKYEGSESDATIYPGHIYAMVIIIISTQ